MKKTIKELGTFFESMYNLNLLKRDDVTSELYNMEVGYDNYLTLRINVRMDNKQTLIVVQEALFRKIGGISPSDLQIKTLNENGREFYEFSLCYIKKI